MLKLNDREILLIALVLEGFFYGLYSGILAMYLQYQASKKDINKKRNVVFLSICGLYVLSVCLFIADVTRPTYQFLSTPLVSAFHISLIEMTLFGCCDFIAQFILIYRCWIVWGCNIRVVIIPSILAFAFLVIWLVGGSSAYIVSDELVTPLGGYLMSLSALAISLTVNALVTGLIVFRIFKVFRKVRATLNNETLGVTGGSKLRSTILILIESGMALFSIQLVRVVVSITNLDVAFRVFFIATSIHNMLNGITPTIILVRTSMGLSFHDEKSMEEVAIGSLCFVSNYPNSYQETRSINIVSRDNRDDDIGVERSNDINIVGRDEDI